MSRHSLFNPDVALCEYSRKCDNPAIKQGHFGGGPCQEHEALFNQKKQEKNRRANQARKERDDAMRSLGLTKVRGAVTGKVYWE